MMNNATPVINLLWTGGWDSTYASDSNSENHIAATLYYLRRRCPVNNELNAIEKLLKILLMTAEQNVIFPTIIIRKRTSLRMKK